MTVFCGGFAIGGLLRLPISLCELVKNYLDMGVSGAWEILETERVYV